LQVSVDSDWTDGSRLGKVDRWAHRHGFGRVNGRMRWYWRLTPFPYLCDWYDWRLLKPFKGSK
jgi:hypothetical protein